MIGSKHGERIAIFGAYGSIGRRYQAILKCIGLDPVLVDLDTGPVEIDSLDGIIIATPTETHLDILEDLIDYKGPILCEKPLSTNPAEVELALDVFQENKMRLTMVDQYRFCLLGKIPGPNLHSYYNYFHSGRDGLAWDCINIIGHSHTLPTLSNDSPVWFCSINGIELTREEMDHAYISMIENWLTDKGSNYEYILKAHNKVREYLNAKSSLRDSGQVYID